MTESPRSSGSISRLALFPLGTVLFPGLVLPLHVFEERYRLLVHDLLALPAHRPRLFGVVAIELGHEVGAGAAHRLAPVGCTAELRGVTPHDDGRFDIVTSGGTRFRIETVDDSLPYLRADVTLLPDELGAAAEPMAERVSVLFHRYRRRLAEMSADSSRSFPAATAGGGSGVVEPSELPADPVRMSYLIAASMLLNRQDRQQLLEAEHAAARLALAGELLSREIRLLDSLPTVPASDFQRGGTHPN